MSDDLLITPGSRKQEFKDSSGNVDAKIETDSSGNLKITNAGGDIEIGDTSSDVYIGDGTNSVDIVFEQDGSIRGTSGVTLTLGASGSSVVLASDLSLGGNDLTNVGDLTVTGNLNITGDINSTSVTDLDVTDKTITVGVGQNEASSGGSGLVVAGSGAQVLWDEADNRFEFNKNVYTTGQWQGNGSGLNTLNASNISSGTIADARLTSRVFLGNNSGTISGGNSQSFDDKTANGIHYISNWTNGTGTTNGPSHEGNAYGWGMLRVTQFIDANYVVQEYIPHNDDGAFIRVKWNGTWGPWRQTWSSRSDGANSGLDADKLDGQHGSYYAAASSIPSVGNGTLTISTSGIASGGGTFTANQSGNTTITISASESDTLDSVTDRGNTTPNAIAVGGASIHTTGGTHGLITNSFSIRQGSSDLMYMRPSALRSDNGFFQWQTYNGGNGGDIELQPYGGSVTISTGSSDTSSSRGLRFQTGSGNYSDGRYQHRFRKRDMGGGIPLYIDTSGSTANSFSELARFGTYTGNTYEFEVQGDINATGAVYSNGSAVLTSHQSLTAYAPIASPTFTGDLNMPSKLRHVGDTNTYIQFHAADQFRVVAGGAEVTEWRNDRMQMNGKSITWDNWLDFDETALSGFTYNVLNAPIHLPAANVGTTNTYLPFLQGSAQHGSGYRTSYVFGAYKRAMLSDGTTQAGWGDGHSGFFMAMGDSDSYPTEEFRFSYDGKIWHSGSGSGNTYIDFGDANALKFNANGSQRMEITAGGTTFGDNVALGGNQLENIGDAYFNEYLYHNGDTDTYIRFEANSMKFRTGGGDRLQVENATVTVNADLNLTAENTTGDNSIHLPRGGEITFYGDQGSHHSMSSKSNSGTVTDDLTISSYGALYIDLDSNSNNTSGADFVISRHNATAHLFKVDGETGAGKGLHSYPNASADGVSLSSYAQGTVPINQGVVQIRSVGKTGWANGDEMGSIDWYNNDGSGVGPRNLARIVAVNTQGNGTSTTTFNGELHFYTSDYNSQLNSSAAMKISASNKVAIGDGTDAGSCLQLRPADDGTADDIQFYNGSTRVGEIGTQDTSWLRINSSTNKNIYTPRYIRADNGLFVMESSVNYGINNAGNGVFRTSVTVGATAITGSVTVHDGDGEDLTLNGWGLSMNRGASYIRPSTDNNKTLYIGGADDSLDWLQIHFRTGGGLYMTGTRFMDTGRNLENIPQATIGKIHAGGDTSNYPDGTDPDISTDDMFATVKVVSPKFVWLNDASGDDNYVTCDDGNTSYSVDGNGAGAWWKWYGDKTLSHAGHVFDYWKGKGAELSQNIKMSTTGGEIRFYSDTYSINAYGQSVYRGGATTNHDSRNGLRFYHSAGPQMSLWYHAAGTGIGNMKIFSSNTGVGDCFQFSPTGAFHAKDNITAYSTTTTSDARLKENVRDLEGSLDKTLRLRGVKFDWIDENRPKDNLGFIAQEIEEVIPEVVKDITDIDGEEHKVVNYQAVVPVLVEAIKEQQSLINRLEERLKVLEEGEK